MSDEAPEIGQLKSMGFPSDLCAEAWSTTRNLEAAVMWIVSKQEGGNSSANNGAGGATATTPAAVGVSAEDVADGVVAEATANSIKCEECGKLFRDMDHATFHSAKSGHTQFAESTEIKKPLTDEEKAIAAEELKEKMRLRRIQREEEDKRDAIEREKIRRKAGKNINEIRYEHDQVEMKRLAEARRREKLEEQAIRDRIKAQIQADRENMKAKSGGQNVTPKAVPTAVPSSSAVADQGAKKTYNSTKIRVKLPGGVALTREYKSTETLSSVRVQVVQALGAAIDDGADLDRVIEMFMPLPRRVFTAEDMQKPLVELGLVPSAAIVVALRKSPSVTVGTAVADFEVD